MLLASTLSAQVDPEVKTLNKPLQPHPINNTFTPKLDSIERDWTNGLRDDTALYYNVRSSNRSGLDSNQRLIYFLHGLGGTPNSWKGSYDGLISDYEYRPKRPNYYTNQKNFINATYEAHSDMGNLKAEYFRDYFYADSVYKRLPPYVIGHSQGGLVARDMDMKHDSNDVLDTRIDYTNRRFWGIITFGTPHAGSYFAVNQDDLANLGGELFSRLAVNEVKNFFGNQALKTTMFKGLISSIGLKTEDLIDFVGTDLVPKMANIAAKDNRDPITKQYGPKMTTYVNDTLNYSNPNMPKGLFYGVEEDPLIWRISHYMITKDPGEYGDFGANDDSKLATNMEDFRLKLVARVNVHQGHINWHNSRINSFRNHSILLRPFFQPAILNAQKKIREHTVIKNSNSDAAIYLSKVNLLYKVILGTFADSNTTTNVIGYNCQKTVVIRRKPLFGNNDWTTWPVIATTRAPKHRVGPGSSCPSSYNQHYKVNNRWRRREITYTSTPVVSTSFVETPSDGVVLKPSQRAFPGCLDDHKREMNEKYDPLTGTIVPVGKSKVNHMQMRNCEETKAAMMRIYNGDGSMPYFFKLVRR